MNISKKYFTNFIKYNKYSSKITQNKNHGAAQAMLYALNLKKNDLNKCQVGIGSVWFEGNPCNNKLNYLSPKVLPFIILNVIYTIYLFYYYSKYISKDKQITNVNKKCSLLWPWTKYYKYGAFYLGMLLISGWFAIDNTKYFSMVFLTIGLTAAISFKYFKTNFAELWCFFSAFAPILYLGVSKSIK